jgi:hypothetical protein
MQASRGAQKSTARYRKVKGKFCGRIQVAKENCVAIDGLRESRGEEQVIVHQVEKCYCKAKRCRLFTRVQHQRETQALVHQGG